jgi:hypothetical protein
LALPFFPKLLNPPESEDSSPLVFQLMLPHVAGHTYLPVLTSSYSDCHADPGSKTLHNIVTFPPGLFILPISKLGSIGGRNPNTRFSHSLSLSLLKIFYELPEREIAIAAIPTDWKYSRAFLGRIRPPRSSRSRADR